MKVNLRCEKCGAFVTVDARPGRKARCSRCGRRISVPAALASLPRPRAPGEHFAGQRVHVSGDRDRDEGRVTVLLARSAPWIISLFFHAGLVLVTLLVAIIVMQEPVAPPPRPAGGLSAEGERFARLGAQPGQPDYRPYSAMQGMRTIGRGNNVFEGGTEPATVAWVDRDVAAVGPGGFRPEGRGRGTRPDPDTPSVKLIPVVARADDVVYVIDSSGSMGAEGAFDLLKMKLAESISRLKPTQRFHVIFFGEKRQPLELRARRLVPASEENKLEVTEFLDKLVPAGRTLVLPALQRAFEVLKEDGPADEDRVKLIMLLSDGDFEGYLNATSEYKSLRGNEAVLAWLKDHNKEIRKPGQNPPHRREIKIHTILYRGDDPQAVSVMRKIAEEHGGSFAHVRSYE